MPNSWAPLDDASHPLLLKHPKAVMQFFEQGDWLRIQALGRPDRYINMAQATQFLSLIGSISISEEEYHERRNN